MMQATDLPADARILVTGAGGYLGQSLVHTLRQSAPATWQWVLTDFQAPEMAAAWANVRWVAGDLSDAALRRDLMAQPVDAVLHLAGLMSGRTEQDVDLGEQVNLLAALDLMALCRAQWRHGGRQVRWVMTSSIAVYGTPLPARIDDETPQQPSLSYGTHKRMLELMLDDMDRRGDLQARAVRLSGVVMRPALPNGALSGFNSDVMREPLAGRDYTCPVSADASIWLLSLPAAVAHVSALLLMPQEKWRAAIGDKAGCAVNAPAWPVRIADVVQALASIDPQAPARVKHAPQAAVQAQFGCWPMQASFARACALGLLDERQAFGNDLAAFVGQLALTMAAVPNNKNDTTPLEKTP